MTNTLKDSTTSLYRDEAIPLIILNTKTHKLEVNDDAIEFIKSVKGPIGVVSVAGMYRTGKSYLLNRMILDRSNGFGVGPTVNPCTKGLWIWGRPIPGQSADGEPINIFVIDSEGIGALDEDSTHDSRIFSLAILLSSCFLYNSVGSIDETAIQNLSLIVNLTKNIQVRSQSYHDDEPDCEDYAKYFPSFVWVVRDFTLQLVDTEGDPITSKDYLERALAPQKGFSDSVENKNRIRRLLCSFFKERDCFCLVRPLTNEDNLQNLDSMEVEKLRPEFFEQMMYLRKTVLNRIRPKQIDGKSLSGAMYAGLVHSYIRAINEGAVPNIENAWSYVCQSECMKAAQEGADAYDATVREILQDKLPLPLDELKNYHAMGKDKAMALFKKKAIGDQVEEYLKDMRRKIKQKFQALKHENEKEASRVCSSFIIKEFSGINKKLKSNEYKSFHDFERDLRLFNTYFMDNGPNAPNKRLIILEFLQKSLNDGANFFIKQLQQEFELQKTISSDTQKKLQEDIVELRTESTKERNYLLNKISQLESEKVEMDAREKRVNEEIANLKREKAQFEDELRSEMAYEKESFLAKIESLKNRLIQGEETVKEVERKAFLSKSEFDKEKALLTQKVTFLEKSLEEVSKREKELSLEVKNTKKDHVNQLKETSTKYDNANKCLQARINQLEERNSELENELAMREQQSQLDRKRLESSGKGMNSSLAEAQSTIENLHRQLLASKEKAESQLTQLKEDSNKQITDLQERIANLESSNKNKDENLKAAKGNAEKEKAILTQKIEFLELQLTEAKSQHAEIKKAYEATLKVFENDHETNSSKTDEKQLKELKEAHRRELKTLETEFESIRKRLSTQIEQLTEKNNELELKSKLEINDLKKEIQTLREDLESSEAAKEKLNEQNRTLEAQKMKLVKETEARFNQRIKALESDLEQKTQKGDREIKEIQRQSEDNLAQLKNMYEIEKERLERKLVEEKEKYDRKISALTEEYESKIREEQQNHEEEIENYKEDLRESEIQNANLTNQYEHELSLKQQAIDTLENHLKETKETLQKLQSSNASTLEQHLTNFTSERGTLMTKVETLTLEVAKKDKEIFALSQIKEQLETTGARKEAAIEKERKELNDEKKALSESLEDYKARYNKLNNEYLQKQVEYGRELALSNQQNEFLSKKIEELQGQIDEITTRYEEKLKLQKQEYVQEYTERIDRLTQEKTAVEEKYEKTKRSLKEVESTYNGQLAALEKEKSGLQDKIMALEAKRSEQEKRLLNDSQSSSTQISELKERFQTERKQLHAEIEKYKTQFFQLEQDHAEINSNYERDKALWKGKFNFLEQQKEQVKSELIEAQRKFEITIQQLQKNRNADRADIESSHQATISNLEAKHQAQIQELTEGHKLAIQELEEKNKKLEKEIKTLKDNQAVENHGKKGSQSFVEKKMIEMAENEKRALKELEAVKEDRDAKILEFQRLLDSERESLKQKIQDAEQKYKEAESKKNNLVFEHEKKIAKMNMEKDHLINQKQELQESLERLEKKKEALLRENEKLKNESKANRRSITMNGGLTSNIALANKQIPSQLSSQLTSQKSTRPASPLSNDSVNSSRSMDKLKDISNYNGIKPYEPNKTGYKGFSTTTIEDDPSQ